MNGSLRVKDKIYLIKMHISTKINFTIFTYLYLLHLSFSFRSLEELPCLPFGIVLSETKILSATEATIGEFCCANIFNFLGYAI